MGILDVLMSSDPMVSAQRRGILEQLASMSGPQPIAPSMGQLAGAVSAGARQGKRDYMADEMAEFQYGQMKAPNHQVVGDSTTGYDLITIPKGELNDMGEYVNGDITVENIKKGKGVTPKASDIFNVQHAQTGEQFSITSSEYYALDPEVRKNLLKFSGSNENEALGGQTGLRNFEDQMIQFGKTEIVLKKLQEQLSDPQTLTTSIVPGVANLINNLRAEITQGVQVFADDERTQEITSKELMTSNADLLKEVIAETQIAESLLITAAYAKALTMNPDGRISDKDFKYALESLRGASKDKTVISRIINESVDTNRRFANLIFDRGKAMKYIAQNADIGLYFGTGTQPNIIKLD